MSYLEPDPASSRERLYEEAKFFYEQYEKVKKERDYAVMTLRRNEGALQIEAYAHGVTDWRETGRIDIGGDVPMERSKADLEITDCREGYECGGPKQKYPTPDQFLDPNDIEISRLFMRRGCPAVTLRQLDAARHAIAHLRRLRSYWTGAEYDDLLRPFVKFLYTLDDGTEFPEMPR